MAATLRFVILILTLSLTSCQKEIDWGTGGGNAGTLLYRVSTVSGTDTTTVDYSYDAAGRLVREKTTGLRSGISMDNDLRIYRNATGVITRTVQQSPAFTALGVDSVITAFYYNPAVSRYTAASFSLTLLGFSVTDSAVFTYDGTGKINKDEHYLSSGALGVPVPAMLMLRNVYNYDPTGNNLLRVTQETAGNPGDPLTQAMVQTYTVDAAINPLVLLNEAIVLSRPALFNAGNITSVSVSDIANPANNFSESNLYFYNRLNRPDSAHSTTTPGGAVNRIAYFYR